MTQQPDRGTTPLGLQCMLTGVGGIFTSDDTSTSKWCQDPVFRHQRHLEPHRGSQQDGLGELRPVVLPPDVVASQTWQALAGHLGAAAHSSRSSGWAYWRPESAAA
jgi:hypothetical protein